MDSKANWKNAIFQYQNAKNTLPQNYDARYRLVLTYYYQCEDIQQGCIEGQEELNYLFSNYPENTDLTYLRTKFNLLLSNNHLKITP